MGNDLPVTKTSDLPPRFREAAFRRFESVIANAVNMFPVPVRVAPRDYGLAPVTFACRLRDAMTSYHRYMWTSSAINRDKFNEIYDLIVVAEHEGEIIVGRRDTTRTKFVQAPTTPTRSGTYRPNLDTTPLRLLAQLAGDGMLAGPVTVPLTAEEAEFLGNNFDVGVSANDDGTYNII